MPVDLEIVNKLQEKEIARLRKELEAAKQEARAFDESMMTLVTWLNAFADYVQTEEGWDVTQVGGLVCAIVTGLHQRAETAEQEALEVRAMLLRCDNAASTVMDTLERIVQYGSVYDCYDVSDEPETGDIVWQSYELEQMLSRAREEANEVPRCATCGDWMTRDHVPGRAVTEWYCTKCAREEEVKP